VPDRAAVGIVAAFGAGELADFGLDQLGHHLQADGGRGGQQPLAHVLGERSEVAVDAAGQPLRHPVLNR
jgi:hypothetical protein